MSSARARPWWTGVAGLTLAGGLLRWASGSRAAVIARDGAEYMDVARRLLAGDPAALSHHYPPGYPALLVVGGWLGGGVGEGSAVAATAVAGAAVIPAVALLAARACGRSAALFAAFLAAVLPLYVELGGEILADSLHLTLVAWCLVGLQHLLDGGKRAPLVAAAVAIGGGLAYVTRPEALVVLGAGALGLLIVPRVEGTPRRRKWIDVAWLLAPALLALVPFLFFLKGQSAIDGSGGGSFKLTLKQNLGDKLGKLTLGTFLGNGADLVRLWLKSLGPGTLLIVVAALAPTRLRGEDTGGARRRWALLAALVFVAMLVTFALIRSERRFVAVLVLLALPHAGWGGAVLARTQLFSPRSRRPVLATILLATCLPFSLRTPHARKVSYRDAGAVLAEAGSRRVLAYDLRAGYYGGARTVPLLHWLEEGEGAGAEALAEVARKSESDAVVLRVDTEAGAKLSTELTALLGARREEVRREGAVALDVLLLGR